MLSSPTRAGEATRVALLIALTAAVVWGIATRALWDIDEGMHAAMAREMVDSGDWLTPRFNGEPFFDKPVLFTWLGALSIRLLGVTELAARLPGALLGLGTVLAVYALGRRAYGPRAGILGAATLATTGGLVLFSSVVVHDICLTFFVTLCLVLLHRAIEDERRRTTCVLFASASAGLAFLSKGPVGVVLPAGITIAWLVATGRASLLLRLRLGWGLLVFLVVAAPWYVLMAREHPDYLRHFFLEQNLGYFASPESRHPKPWWFYGPIAFYLLAPWSFFLPAALASVRADRSTPAGRTTALLFCWAAVVLLFFSSAESKLAGYIAPLLPAPALLIGVAWSRLEESPPAWLRRTFVAGSALFAALVSGAAVFLALRPPVRVQERYDIEPKDVSVAVALLAVALVISLALLLARRSVAAFAALALTVVGLFAAFSLRFAPKVDLYRSAKAITPRLEERFGPEQDLVCYVEIIGHGDSAVFYAGRHLLEIEGEDEIGAHLDSPGRVFALVSQRHIRHMGANRGRAYVVERVGNLMVVSNRPDAPGDPPGLDPR